MTDEQILDDIIRREGGFTNHPADKGEATKYGITLATLWEWRGHQVNAKDVENLTEAEARDIYRKKYLRPFDGIDAALKPQVVDIAVNAGVTRARILLALALAQDKRPPGVQLVIERLKHYAAIVKARPATAVFMPGWVARATDYL